jgi:hypothetical protein
MALHRHVGSSSSNPDEKPRSEAISWFDLARVVYGWTDGRESAIDRAWWRQTLERYPLIHTNADVTEMPTVH